MSKTVFSSHCVVLGELWNAHKDTDNQVWREFFEWADLGCPLAYMSWQNLATLSEEGEQLVEDTWKVFCEMIGIDANTRYNNLAAAFAASPNSEI